MKNLLLQKKNQRKSSGLEKIASAKTTDEVQEIRKTLLGKKSEISDILKNMCNLSADDNSQIPIKTIDRALLKIDDENSKYLFEVDEPIDGRILEFTGAGIFHNLFHRSGVTDGCCFSAHSHID